LLYEQQASQMCGFGWS